MSLAPAPNRAATWQRVAVLVVAGVAVIAGARYFLQRPLTYEANGISLQYPRTWQQVTGSFTPPAGIDLLWLQGFSLDDDNGIGVAAADIGTAVPELLLEAVATRELEPTLNEAVGAAGGSVAGRESTEIAGRKALLYEATGLLIGAAPVDVTLAVVPNGATVYFIACQRTSEHATEVEAGCDTVIESFAITGG